MQDAMNTALTTFQAGGALADVTSLVPTIIDSKKKEKVLPPHYVQRTVTIVGIKTTTARFLPVSHEGDSNETYIDTVDLLGKTRAEFIARKLKGIERRAHMRLFRELTELQCGGTWQQRFQAWFGSKTPCEIPNLLCTLCWNDSLFGSLEAGKGATFSRVRYFDTYSLQDASICVARLGSDEGLAIGNTVGEDLSKERGDASLHYYEYVKPGTHFPFITVIENATLLDVAGLLNAISIADSRGYGKYSANSGKFSTEILAVSTGVPRFSVLDMLQWSDNSQDENDPTAPIRDRFIANAAIGRRAPFEDNLRGQAATLWSGQTDGLRSVLADEFSHYVAALDDGKA